MLINPNDFNSLLQHDNKAHQKEQKQTLYKLMMKCNRMDY